MGTRGAGADESGPTGDDLISALRAVDWELGDLVRQIETLRQQVQEIAERLPADGGGETRDQK